MVDADVNVARRMTLTLLAARAPEATLCPSEVARALVAGTEGAGAWRDVMPAVHAAVDQLNLENRVGLSWKGQSLGSRAGPYRIRRLEDS